MHADSDLQILELGQAHSIAVSNSNKVYSTGWNDRNQLGHAYPRHESQSNYSQITFPVDNFRPKEVE